MTKEIFSPPTLPPPTGYSHVAKVNKGTLVYIAGQVSSDASGKLVGEGNFRPADSDIVQFAIAHDSELTSNTAALAPHPRHGQHSAAEGEC